MKIKKIFYLLILFSTLLAIPILIGQYNRFKFVTANYQEITGQTIGNIDEAYNVAEKATREIGGKSYLHSVSWYVNCNNAEIDPIQFIFFQERRFLFWKRTVAEIVGVDIPNRRVTAGFYANSSQDGMPTTKINPSESLTMANISLKKILDENRNLLELDTECRIVVEILPDPDGIAISFIHDESKSWDQEIFIDARIDLNTGDLIYERRENSTWNDIVDP